MATITPVSVAQTGTDITLAAASAGGDTVINAAGATLIVANASGASVTVTLAGTLVCPWTQGTVHNIVETVAAGKTRHIPILAQCVDATTGDCGVTYSATASVTVAAVTD